MNYAIHRIYLDIHDTTSQVTIYVKRNDSNRKIVATLMENGKPYSISSECQVGFSSKALPMPVYCEIKDNTIEYVLSTSVTKSVGVHECEFKLYGKDNAVLTSPRFTVIVEDVIFDGDDITEDTPNVSVLDSLISEATTLIDEATTKLKEVDFVSLHDVMYGDKTNLRSKSLVAIMPTENDIGSYNDITVVVSGYEGTERWYITFTDSGLDFSEEQGYFPPFSIECKAGDVVVLNDHIDIHEIDRVFLENIENNVAAKGLFDGIVNASTLAKVFKGKEGGASGLPAVSNEDDGKVLTVVDGKWGVADVAIPYSEVSNTAGGTTVNIG